MSRIEYCRKTRVRPDADVTFVLSSLARGGYIAHRLSTITLAVLRPATCTAHVRLRVRFLAPGNMHGRGGTRYYLCGAGKKTPKKGKRIRRGNNNIVILPPAPVHSGLLRHLSFYSYTPKLKKVHNVIRRLLVIIVSKKTVDYCLKDIDARRFCK